MQVIHVLSDQKKVATGLGELCYCLMRWIRMSRADDPASLAIPFPDEAGITLECLRCCQLCGIQIPPIPVLTPKSWDAAFGGNTCSGDYEDAQIRHGHRRAPHPPIGRTRLGAYPSRRYRLSRPSMVLA